MIYDIFYVSNREANTNRWQDLKNQYPTAQKLENITSFDQIKKRAFTQMFWVIWDDLILSNNFNLTTYRATKWDSQYVHIFKNGKCLDGICLFPKSLNISNREFENRFFINKKEVDIVASFPVDKIYDIVFISYEEPNADENYNKLIDRFPRAKRVHGVKGIHQAHIEAAKLSVTDMFYVVDGDAIIDETFNFDYTVPKFEQSHVHVWKSKNPVNGLEYGYGGVKLLPTVKTLSMDVTTADMTTSISNNFKAMPEVSNITAFNTDPFNSWKSAFRECVKLSSRIIDRQDDTETQVRLTRWCTIGSDLDVIAGAIAGKDYGIKNKNNKEALKKINDFKWLEEKFNEV
jgi:hypothetical protein